MYSTRSSADTLDREVGELRRGEFEIRMPGLNPPQHTQLWTTLPNVEDGGHIVWRTPEQKGVVWNRLFAQQVEGAVKAILDRSLRNVLGRISAITSD
jgi:hypothetical protein